MRCGNDCAEYSFVVSYERGVHLAVAAFDAAQVALVSADVVGELAEANTGGLACCP
jgi:hypothetical protein